MPLTESLSFSPSTVCQPNGPLVRHRRPHACPDGSFAQSSPCVYMSIVLPITPLPSIGLGSSVRLSSAGPDIGHSLGRSAGRLAACLTTVWPALDLTHGSDTRLCSCTRMFISVCVREDAREIALESNAGPCDYCAPAGVYSSQMPSLLQHPHQHWRRGYTLAALPACGVETGVRVAPTASQHQPASQG